MNALELESARLTYDEVVEVSHILAAANHYQWSKMEFFVIPALEKGDGEAIKRLLKGDYPQELQRELLRFAGDIINIVRAKIGGFIYPVEAHQLVPRKIGQLTHWFDYAMACPPSSYERWKLQCRTPFLELPLDMRSSDYEQALLDLRAVAEAAGLVLPHRLPDTAHIGQSNNRPIRCLHQLGRHGLNVTSERPWQYVCMACGREWHVDHGVGG